MAYNFKMVHTGKDLAISTTVLLAGIGLLFLNKGLGICIGICGLLMFVFYKGGYRLDGRGIMLTRKSEDICKDCRTSLMDFLEGFLLPLFGKDTKAVLSESMYISIKQKELHTSNCMISATIFMNLQPESSNSMAQGRKHLFL